MAGVDALVPIGSVTLSATQASVSFDAIPQNFRDLRVVVAGSNTYGNSIDVTMQYNSDTASNYVNYLMYGTGSSAAIYGDTRGQTLSGRTGTGQSVTIINIMDYSMADRQKVELNRGNDAGGMVQAGSSRWTSTAAITSVKIASLFGSFTSGSTFNLFGVRG